ncbi:hypothetical protein [Corynebacterium casei]|uniref:hypothetical protein n=1 Tax=Corynebacterium casei TaxID=160386 RepID=UPI0018672423|nr:hypothetical protein [Corynebacterium casei]
MDTKARFTLNQRIKAATTVFAVMAVANAVLLLVFSTSGQDIAFSTAAGVPILAGLTLGGLFALTMGRASFNVQMSFWILTSAVSALAFTLATYMIFF